MKRMLLYRRTAAGRALWKPLLLAFAGWMVGAGTCHAQPAGRGYVAVGVGDLGEIAGGSEALIQDRFGVGGEAGLLSGGITLFSVNGSLHVPKSSSRIGSVPFVSGGHTRMVSLAELGGSRNAFNVGGGLTYWFTDRTGVLMEVRDVVFWGVGIDQLWVARVGIAFRSGRERVAAAKAACETQD